jgi:hypothetical protein
MRGLQESVVQGEIRMVESRVKGGAAPGMRYQRAVSSDQQSRRRGDR